MSKKIHIIFHTNTINSVEDNKSLGKFEQRLVDVWLEYQKCNYLEPSLTGRKKKNLVCSF